MGPGAGSKVWYLQMQSGDSRFGSETTGQSDDLAWAIDIGGADLEALTTWLYPELRKLARRALAGERANHTLQTTSLVHEAWLQLAETEFKVHSRGHFLALCARLMRRILIDHARGRNRLKRGGEQRQVTLSDAMAASEAPSIELLSLDRAMTRLESIDPRRARLLECQLLAGMTYPEMAEAMAISEATIHRELRLARAWLKRELNAPADG